MALIAPCCSGCYLKLVARPTRRDVTLALLGTPTVWLIYAAGLKYLLLFDDPHAPGLGFFLHAVASAACGVGNRAEGSVAALVLVPRAGGAMDDRQRSRPSSSMIDRMCRHHRQLVTVTGIALAPLVEGACTAARF